MENYFETAPLYYFSFNDNGEIIHVNETLCIDLGYLKEELTGIKLEKIFPIASKIFYQTHFFPLLKMHGHASEIFIFLKTKNGAQLPILMNAKRAESAGTMHNQCACIVVQNRKKFEDELVKAKKAAEKALFENTALKKAKEELAIQAEKLDGHLQLIKKQNNELKQLSRIATHNLWEPLRKVLVFANIIRDKPEIYLQQNNIREKLVKATNLMNDTVLGLQQFTWLHEEDINPVPVDLDALFSDVKKQLADELKEDLLEISGARLPVINADNKQLHLLFYQLLLNSVQYRKPGTRATVSVTSTILKKNAFRTVTDKYNFLDYLKIEIADKGIGFEPQYRHQVFELFKKLHHLERAGLGLSFCKLIVENHGGYMEAESEPSKGTSISIFFPGSLLA